MVSMLYECKANLFYQFKCYSYLSSLTFCQSFAMSSSSKTFLLALIIISTASVQIPSVYAQSIDSYIEFITSIKFLERLHFLRQNLQLITRYHYLLDFLEIARLYLNQQLYRHVQNHHRRLHHHRHDLQILVSFVHYY